MIIKYFSILFVFIKIIRGHFSEEFKVQKRK